MKLTKEDLRAMRHAAPEMCAALEEILEIANGACCRQGAAESIKLNAIARIRIAAQAAYNMAKRKSQN